MVVLAQGSVGERVTVLDGRIWLDAGHEVLHLSQTQPWKTFEEIEHVPATTIKELGRRNKDGGCSEHGQHLDGAGIQWVSDSAKR